MVGAGEGGKGAGRQTRTETGKKGVADAWRQLTTEPWSSFLLQTLCTPFRVVVI